MQESRFTVSSEAAFSNTVAGAGVPEVCPVYNHPGVILKFM